jgi:hypothetical protein
VILDFEPGHERPTWAPRDDDTMRRPIGSQQTPVSRRLVRNARLVKALFCAVLAALVALGYGLWHLVAR